MIFILLFISVIFLAYSNGANDNFKGVATLFGSGTNSYKRALNWATFTTFAGSIASIFFASVLVKNFSGKDLISDELIGAPEFGASIALASALTVFLATKIGMPISTTHSLVGALFGTGIIAVGRNFNFEKLASVFLTPLIVSPLIAAVLSFAIYHAFKYFRKKSGIKKSTCICVGNAYVPVNQLATDNFVSVYPELQTSIRISTDSECREIYEGKFLGIGVQKALDYAHYLSAGVVSFARGLNDTPKIVGLILAINALNIQVGLIVLAVAMAVGGLLNAKKVAQTVSKKITPMDAGQGFTANLITGLLVTTASIHGLPVSTTHVSVGSLFGIGAVTRKANLGMIRKILLSWVLTLPAAAILSASIYSLLSV